MPTVITANRLRTGTVVYLGSTGEWVECIEQAAVAHDDGSMQRFGSIAAAAVEQCKVTAVYAFAVHVDCGRPVPLSMRERIRASRAPTI